MPELPEVESYRLRLIPALQGKTIQRVKCAAKNYAFLTSPGTLKARLPGMQVRELRRLGKYILIDLAQPDEAHVSQVFLVHLGMTGQIFSKEYEPDVHVHMQWWLSGTKHPLVFRDPRKFGKLKLLAASKADSDPRLARLGPDALAIDAQRLWDCSRGRKASVKGLLLDQSVSAGIGNIYADEALFASGIRPTRPAQKLSKPDCQRLSLALREILQEAIAAGGSSISDYVLPDGSLGYFQRSHKVYGREGLPCVTCETPVRKVVVAQRGTHYCRRCQPK